MVPHGAVEVLTTLETNDLLSVGVPSHVGLNAVVGKTIGADSGVRLAEASFNASCVLFRSMIAVAGLSYGVATMMLVKLMFCFGVLLYRHGVCKWADICLSSFERHRVSRDNDADRGSPACVN